MPMTRTKSAVIGFTVGGITGIVVSWLPARFHMPIACGIFMTMLVAFVLTSRELRRQSRALDDEMVQIREGLKRYLEQASGAHEERKRREAPYQ